MQWKKIGLFVAAGAMLLMSGCDAAASIEPTAAVSDAAASEEPAAEPSETVATESAEVSAGDDAVSTLPPASEDATVTVRGTVTDIDWEQNLVTISEGDDAGDPQTSVAALITGDTLLIDNESGRTVSADSLETGRLVSAAVSQRMTRSIPPQAQAYAIFVDVPENGLGTASYIQALDVMKGENDDTIVLNQNADLYVTIPATLKIEKLDGGAASASDIKVGSVLIAWYDAVAESYPAQTTAIRVVLVS